MSRLPRIAITLGDPCGIGPEILVRSLYAINRWAEVVIVGSRAGVELLANTQKRMAWRWGLADEPIPAELEVEAYSFQTAPEGAGETSPLAGRALWLDPAPVSVQDLKLGEGSANSGRCAIEAVKLGAQLMMLGEADALVTLPLAKSAAHAAGFAIPGHTEFLQALSGAPLTRMAFVSPSLSVVLHTVHQSLRSVMDDLDVDSVAETLSFAADRFIQFTGKNDLRVALCALNPHAGENGAFGEEEGLLREAVIQAEASFMDFNLEGKVSPFASVPSPFPPGPPPDGWEIFPNPLANDTQALARFGGFRGIEVVSSQSFKSDKPAPRFFGPLPADSLFHRAAKKEFDLVVALYHDQGLIPMKVLEPSRAVNLTLGLPFIRTSPDHGTAFDRAGKWVADPANFLEATALAVRLAARARAQPWKAVVGNAE
jgi:4-phospho-D-threonate 3-dehydrogenase / 4-phospho-D-erythronate 3-dehydrogenase